MLEKGAYCRDGYIHGTYNQEGTFADLETCAKQCESEDSCYFFAFANGLTCSRLGQSFTDSTDPAFLRRLFIVASLRFFFAHHRLSSRPCV